MEIDIKNISKEDLIKIWEQYHTNPDFTLSAYCKWLESETFGSDVMNSLAKEISTTMTSIYVHGCEYYDTEKDDFVTYTVDKINPDVEDLFEFSLATIQADIDLLEEYGITIRKNPTKKCPLTYDNIDWGLFNKFKN